MNILFSILIVQILRVAVADFCQSGYYGPDSQMCTACQDNYSSTQGSNIDSSSCFPCPENQTSSSGNTCSPCPDNFYSQSGQYCIGCPDNQQSTGGQSCTACPQGQSSVSGSSCSDATTFSKNQKQFIIKTIFIIIFLIL
ncbi:hypothetical protein ABPG74_000699 [Tetrahymena malaccensis]